MLKADDLSALKEVRAYFDDLGYGYVNQRLADRGLPLLYPHFGTLQGILKTLNPIYSLLICLFRQGHPADDSVLRSSLPATTFEAMVSTGLLVQNKRRQWQTPGLIVIPVEGLYLAVSTPPQYPTAIAHKHPVYLGQDSLWLIAAYPPRLTGRRVLDICAGSGVQGLVCAMRGASQVVGLEKSETAYNVARFNVALNDLADRVEIRHSDLFAALNDGETFDFVVTNPPFMPVMEDAGGADGTRLIKDLFRGLPNYLADEAEGFMVCVALGDQYSINLNRDVLLPFAEKEDFYVSAWVHDKTPIATYMSEVLENNLRGSCPKLSTEQRRARIVTWHEQLLAQGVAASQTYGEVVRFQKRNGYSGVVNLPVYNPLLTDPLLARTSLPRERT